MRAEIGCRCVFGLLVMALLAGCSVQYVADYDAQTRDETLRIARTVDYFWVVLLDTPKEQRKYEYFQSHYNGIEADIRALLMRNQIRTDNESTVKQLENLLGLWEEDKKLHKEKNTFSDFEARRHKKQFLRVFIAILKGEDAKDV